METAGHIIWQALVLAIPFMSGVIIGVDLVQRRPKESSTDEKFGQFIRAGMVAVVRQRKWVGDGVTISRTIDMPLPGAPNMKIIVRDEGGA